jgi:hypothetical protein
LGLLQEFGFLFRVAALPRASLHRKGVLDTILSIKMHQQGMLDVLRYYRFPIPPLRLNATKTEIPPRVTGSGDVDPAQLSDAPGTFGF